VTVDLVRLKLVSSGVFETPEDTRLETPEGRQKDTRKTPDETPEGHQKDTKALISQPAITNSTTTETPDKEPPPNAVPRVVDDFESIPSDTGTEPFHADDAPIPMAKRERAPQALPDGAQWTGNLKSLVGHRTAAVWLRAWGALWGEADIGRMLHNALAGCPAKHAAQCLWHDMADNVKSRTGVLVELLRGRWEPDPPRSGLVRWGSLPPSERASICPLDVAGTDFVLTEISTRQREADTARKDADAMTDEEIAAEAAALKERLANTPKPTPEPRTRRKRQWPTEATNQHPQSSEPSPHSSP
jgi:hypothetical protein